jgi:hypothetical protein
MCVLWVVLQAARSFFVGADGKWAWVRPICKHPNVRLTLLLSPHAVVDATRGRVVLSQILKWYRRDFGDGSVQGMLGTVVQWLPDEQQAALGRMLAEGGPIEVDRMTGPSTRNERRGHCSEANPLCPTTCELAVLSPMSQPTPYQPAQQPTHS